VLGKALITIHLSMTSLHPGNSRRSSSSSSNARLVDRRLAMHVLGAGRLGVA